MKKTPLILLIYLSFSFLCLANSVPKNELHIPTSSYLTSKISEDDYNKITDEAIFPWIKIANQYQAKLINQKDWKSDWVYAAAEQRDNLWMIRIKGGLARHPYMTKDALTLIVCHELGHHFGGFPFAYYWVWNSSEGQADYFSTQVCAKHLWRDKHNENRLFRDIIGNFEKEKCDQIWSMPNEQNLCYRISYASLKLAIFYAKVSKHPLPSFNTPDQSQVEISDPKHPKSQCRLDTLFQGLICNTFFDLYTIPGLETSEGRDSLEAEIEASKYSCMLRSNFKTGLRPTCWFKENNI